MTRLGTTSFVSFSAVISTITPGIIAICFPNDKIMFPRAGTQTREKCFVSTMKILIVTCALHVLCDTVFHLRAFNASTAGQYLADVHLNVVERISRNYD